MKLSIIDWRITSKCNNNCEFCYGNKGINTTQNFDKIIENIKKSGCEAVCITGGEPLLEDKVYYILEKLHNLGISIYLSTNGTNYMLNKNKIEPYISKLSLPLDGYDNFSNTINGRINGSFETVKEILDYYEKNKPNFRIKIGTVLTKSNMFQENFEKLFDFLSQYSIIKKWKIFELIPEGNGSSLFQNNGYTYEEYNIMQKRIEKYVYESKKDYSFDIDFSHRQNRDSAYFIIIPDGKVIIPIDEGDSVNEKVLGDILSEDIDRIISNWQSNCNELNCFTNFEKRIASQSLAVQLDNVDRRILYYFDKDPLELNTSLEENLYLRENMSLSREEIDNRLNYLYDIRAIDHVMPLINIANFGLDLFLCNLYFKKEMKNQVDHIASFLCYNGNIAWVAECYDWQNDDKYLIFRIAIYAKNNSQMYDILNKICKRFNTSLYNWEIDNVPEKNVLGQRYIINDKNIDNSSNYNNGYINHHIKLDCSGIYNLTKKQYKVFLFPKDKQYNIFNLAKYMRMNQNKTKNVIEKLISENIIQKYQAVYNHEILGYKWYKFFIKFKNLNNKNEFEQEIMKYDCVTHTNTLTQGTWDLDFEINVKSPPIAFNFWDKIKSNYQDKILREKIIRINKEYKFDFLPQVVLKAMEDSVK